MKIEWILNKIIKYIDVSVYRVIDINSNGSISIINTDGKSMPEIRHEDDTIMNLNNGTLKIVDEDNYISVIREEELSDLEKKHRDRAYEIVSNILKDNKFNIWHSRKLSHYIKNISLEYDISTRTAKRYLVKYLIGGQTKNSLLPDYYKCGGKNKEKN